MSIEKMYGEDDIALAPPFQGGYINFGYWESVPLAGQHIPLETRVESSRRLYQVVLEQLQPRQGDHILEVGCGRGLGLLIAATYAPGRLVGIDAANAQIERARQTQKQRKGEFELLNAIAERIPFPDKSFDGIYSVEAAQHFDSILDFLGEVVRLLRPGGRLSLTTFFATNSAALPQLRQQLPTVASDIDRLIPIEHMTELMRSVGLAPRIQSIGPWVWAGFDRWLEQAYGANEMVHRWLDCYSAGQLDYYIVTAEAPK